MASDSYELKHGVLLYYCYVALAPPPEGEQEAVHAFYESNCGELGLQGRVRVAQGKIGLSQPWPGVACEGHHEKDLNQSYPFPPADGVNVTVGGPIHSLKRHMDAVEAHPLLGDRGIDFKLAEAGSRHDGRVCAETGFDTLSVRFCRVRSKNPVCVEQSCVEHGKHCLNANNMHSLSCIYGGSCAAKE